MDWFEAFGWLGSVLVVLSLMLSDLRRFRTFNLIGSVIATIYNAAIDIWPFAAMNGAIALINIYWLIRLHRDRFVSRTYQVLAADLSSDAVQHMLSQHADEITGFYPQFDPHSPDEGRHAFLVVNGDVTVGLVVLHDIGDATAQVEVDYVTKAYRNYSPGEFVYQDSGVISDLGLQRLLVPASVAGDEKYFRRVGFVPADDGLVLQVAAA